MTRRVAEWQACDQYARNYVWRMLDREAEKLETAARDAVDGERAHAIRCALHVLMEAEGRGRAHGTGES